MAERGPSGTGHDTAPTRGDAFDAILTVWEYAVSVYLPNPSALSYELSRLQRHAGLESRPDA